MCPDNISYELVHFKHVSLNSDGDVTENMLCFLAAMLNVREVC